MTISQEPAKPGLIKQGDVVYFKECSRETKRSAFKVGAKGHFYGVMLGMVPPFAPEPPDGELLISMGAIGFISFDDVIEFLGKEVGDDIIKKFGEKYYAKKLILPGGDKATEAMLDHADKTGMEIKQ